MRLDVWPGALHQTSWTCLGRGMINVSFSRMPASDVLRHLLGVDTSRILQADMFATFLLCTAAGCCASAGGTAGWAQQPQQFENTPEQQVRGACTAALLATATNVLLLQMSTAVNNSGEDLCSRVLLSVPHRVGRLQGQAQSLHHKQSVRSVQGPPSHCA